MPSQVVPSISKEKSVPLNAHFKIFEVEIVHPGIAFNWDDGATGLYIKTNLHPDDINRREGKAIFRSDEHVWAWAKKIAARRV